VHCLEEKKKKKKERKNRNTDGDVAMQQLSFTPESNYQAGNLCSAYGSGGGLGSNPFAGQAATEMTGLNAGVGSAPQRPPGPNSSNFATPSVLTADLATAVSSTGAGPRTRTSS
jgi:hypothetical protein